MGFPDDGRAAAMQSLAGIMAETSVSAAANGAVDRAAGAAAEVAGKFPDVDPVLVAEAAETAATETATDDVLSAIESATAAIASAAAHSAAKKRKLEAEQMALAVRAAGREALQMEVKAKRQKTAAVATQQAARGGGTQVSSHDAAAPTAAPAAPAESQPRRRPRRSARPSGQAATEGDREQLERDAEAYEKALLQRVYGVSAQAAGRATKVLRKPDSARRSYGDPR